MTATLRQAKKMLELIDQSGKDVEQLQALFPYLSVLLHANADELNLDDFRKACRPAPVKQKKARQTKFLAVDYSIGLSLVNLPVVVHPDHSGIARLDVKKIKRVSMVRLGEDAISGHEYLQRLEECGEKLHDARVMEEFIKNPDRIPEEWEKGRTYFWGTIFYGGASSRSVAYLRRGDDGRLCRGYSSLDADYGYDEQAAVGA